MRGIKARPGGGSSSPAALTVAVLHVRDEKTVSTNGGTFTSGAWQTRTLNTEVTNDIDGASLASNQITLPAGTYEVIASAPGFAVNGHQARLRDVTNSATLLLGTSEHSNAANYAQTRSFIDGEVTLNAETVVELQHYCVSTFSSTGMGVSADIGTEVYAEVFIRKVEEAATIDGGTFADAGDGTVDGGSL